MIMIEIQYTVIITSGPMHTTSKHWHHMPQLYQLLSEKKMIHCQLCSTRYTAVRINNSTFCNQNSPL